MLILAQIVTLRDDARLIPRILGSTIHLKDGDVCGDPINGARGSRSASRVRRRPPPLPDAYRELKFGFSLSLFLFS